MQTAMRGVAEQEADKVVFVGTYGNRLRRRVTPWALVCNVRRYTAAQCSGVLRNLSQTA